MQADPAAWETLLGSESPPKQWSPHKRAMLLAELGVTQPAQVANALCQLVRENGAETLRMGSWRNGRAVFRNTTRNQELVKLVLQQVQPFLQGRGISALAIQQKAQFTEKLMHISLAVCILGPTYRILDYASGSWRVRLEATLPDTKRTIWAVCGAMYSRISSQDRPGLLSAGFTLQNVG